MSDHGSKLQINLPEAFSNRHSLLSERELPFQHPLESVFRPSDSKSLDTIINEITSGESSFLWEIITVTTNGQTLIELTQFQYNVTKDILLVCLQGLEVFEGTSLDFVKDSSSSIIFNYELHEGEQIFVAIAGTKSNTSFGNDLNVSLNMFKQLADTPKTYYGNGGRSVLVNPEETGLIFGNVKPYTERVKIEQYLNIENNDSIEDWIPFAHSCDIKTIRVTPVDLDGNPITYIGNFNLKLWTKPNGYWIYYSGEIESILYDWMEVSHIDESGEDAIYMKIENLGEDCRFRMEIIISV